MSVKMPEGIDLGPVHLKTEQEKKLALFLAVLGIAISLAVFSHRKSTSAPDSSTTAADTSTTPSGNPALPSGNNAPGMDPIAAALQVAQIQANTAIQEAQIAADHAASFSFNASDQYADTGTSHVIHKGGSSGSAGVSLFGIGLFGGSGGSSSSSESTTTVSSTGDVSSGFAATGLTDAQLAALEGLSQVLGAQQNAHTLAEQEQGLSGNPVASPPHDTALQIPVIIHTPFKNQHA